MNYTFSLRVSRVLKTSWKLVFAVLALSTTLTLARGSHTKIVTPNVRATVLERSRYSAPEPIRTTPNQSTRQDRLMTVIESDQFGQSHESLGFGAPNSSAAFYAPRNEFSVVHREDLMILEGTGTRGSARPLADGGGTAAGGACTCDSDCATPANDCERAICTETLAGAQQTGSGVWTCFVEDRPVDDPCDLDGLYCTDDLCDGAGACVAAVTLGTVPATKNPCVYACSAGASNAGFSCSKDGDCTGGTCDPRSNAAPAGTSTCNETADQCEIDAGGAALGRCCVADACTIDTEANCTGLTGQWLRLVNPRDLNLCECPKYSAGIAPVTANTTPNPLLTTTGVNRICSIDRNPCSNPILDCRRACDVGPDAGQQCMTDVDCDQSGGVSTCTDQTCDVDPNVCDSGIDRIGDDYSIANGSYLRLLEVRFRGGVLGNDDAVTMEIWDGDPSSVPTCSDGSGVGTCNVDGVGAPCGVVGSNPVTAAGTCIGPIRIQNTAVSFGFEEAGTDDYRIIYDCNGNCFPTDTDPSSVRNTALTDPIIIPPTGFITFRALNVVDGTSGDLQEVSQFYIVEAGAAPDRGSNDADAMFVNGVVSNHLGTGNNVLAIELVGTKVPDPAAACCDPAGSPGSNCTDTERWECRTCISNNASGPDFFGQPCIGDRECGGTDTGGDCNDANWKGQREPLNDPPAQICASGVCDTGACCNDLDGSCSEIPLNLCIGANETPQAFGSTCDPNPCVNNSNDAATAKNDGDGSNKTEGDPVELFTGAHVMEVTDLRIPGRGLDFAFTRIYDNNIIYGNGWELGTAWGSPYLQRLVDVNGFDIKYIAGNGRKDLYSFNDGTTWNNAAHYYHDLIRDASAQEFVMTSSGERKTVFHDFTDVQSPGRLKRFEDRFGNTISFLYSGNQLVQIVDSFGRTIDFTYNPDGTISDLTDFSGRSITYSYYNQGDSMGGARQLKSVQAPEVTGTSTGNDFSGTNRKTTTYTYNTSSVDPFIENQILTVTDPKQQTYLQNTYASTTDQQDFLFNRVVEQVYGAGSFQFHYEQINEFVGTELATMLIIVNDRRGLVTETRLNDKGNPVSERQYTGLAVPNTPTTQTLNRPVNQLRPGDPVLFETTTTYDAEGKPIRTTLPEGNFQEFLYNIGAGARHGEDNVLRSTRNVGTVGGPVTELVTQTIFESQYQLRKTATNARGFTTTFFYDYEEATAGDLNGDGITNGNKGLLVRVEQNPVNLGLAGAGEPQDIAETRQYNQFGQLTNKTDGNGDVTTYEYYPENDPDGDGQDIIAGRDGVTGGYLKAITIDPGGLNLKTILAYDRVGNVNSKTDPRNHTTTFEVNQLNQVVRTISPAMTLFDGGETYEKAFVYDANDNVVEIWTEHENAENSGPGTIANTIGFDQANFFETRFTYDILDNVLSETVEVGSDLNFPDAALTTSYTYDPSENLIRVTHPNGDQDETEYDDRDLVFRTIIAANGVAPSVTQLDYDLNGNLNRRINPNPQNIENRTYDGFDRMLTLESVGSQTTTHYSYDKNSNVTNVRIEGPKDGSGTIVDLSRAGTRFDELDRPYEKVRDLFKHEDGSGLQGGALTEAITQVEYDKDNLVVREINPNNHTTLLDYDKADRNTKTTDAVGNVRENVFFNAVSGDNINVSAVITTEVNPTGPPDVFTLLYDYDELNRLRRTEDDLNNVTQIKLDSRGLTAIVTDAETNQSKNKFDGLGRLYTEDRQFEVAGFIELSKKWDARSRLIESIDGEGRVTGYQYDKHNRLTQRNNADTTTREYTYDPEDNLTQLLRENSERIDFAYDDANRLTEKRYFASTTAPNPTITDRYEYNGLNAPSLIEEVNGNSLSYKRESRNLKLTCSQTISGFSAKTFAMDYNAVGNPTVMRYPGGRQVDYANYTDIELLGQISSAGTTVNIDYSGYGRVKQRTYSNGFQMDVGFDAIKRIESCNHKVGIETPVGFSETYDRVHNRRSETFLDTTTSGQNHARVFDLDKYYRVTGFIRTLDPSLVGQALSDFSTITPADGEAHEVIDYDQANNMNAVALDGSVHTVTNNEMNETEQFGALRTNLQYDANGRLIRYQEGGATFHLTWNLRDQLTRVTRNGIEIGRYQYYPTGMRAVKHAGGRTEHFYGVGMTVHHIYERKGITLPFQILGTRFPRFDSRPKIALLVEDLAKEFVFEGLDRPCVMFQDVDDNIETGFRGLEAYFYHANPRGDVYALSNEAGQVVERYDYSLFGDTGVMNASYQLIDSNGISLSDAADSKSALRNPFQWGGAFKDDETCFMNMRFRYYDSRLRRFLSRDPVEDDSLANMYAGFENNPGMLADPMGLMAKGNFGNACDGDLCFGDNTSVLVSNRQFAISIGAANLLGLGQFSASGTGYLPGGSASDSEKLDIVFSIGWWDAMSIGPAKNIAELATKADPGSWGGIADALRHCIWMCELAQRIGAGQAKEVGDIHEAHNPPKPPKTIGGRTVTGPPNGYATWGDWKKDDTAMDIHNNAVGYTLGKTKCNCEDECRKKLKAGSLKVNAPPNGYQFPVAP